MITAFHPAQVVDVQRLLLVLRDMGNGVTRIESATILEHAATVDVSPLGFTPVMFPLSARLSDCVAAALFSLGARSPPEFSAGLVRPVCEDVTEFYFW